MDEERITVSRAAKEIAQSTESIYQWIRDSEITAKLDIPGKQGIKMVLLSEVERQADSTPVRFSLSNETHLIIEQVAHTENISKRAATEMLLDWAWHNWAKEKNDETD